MRTIIDGGERHRQNARRDVLLKSRREVGDGSVDDHGAHRVSRRKRRAHGVRAPLEDLRARPVESDLEQIVEHHPAERRDDEQDCRVFVLIEPEKHSGDEHDHPDDGPGAERRDLEHRRLNGFGLVRAHPVQDGVVESLGRAAADLVRDLGECPREEHGDRRSRQQEDAEDRVGVSRVVPDETQRAEHDIPDEVEMSTRLSGLDDSSVAGRGRRFDGCCHEMKLFKSARRGGNRPVPARLRKSLWARSLKALRRGSQVVRQRSAKPLFAGSIPARASLRRQFARRVRRLSDREGS